MTSIQPAGSYNMTEEARARLILLAHAEGITFAHAVDVVTEFFERTGEAMGCDLQDFESIIALSKALQLQELPVKHLKAVLQFLSYLHSKQLGMGHVTPVIALYKRLEQFGLSVEASELTRILEVTSTIVANGIPALELEKWLDQWAKQSSPS